MEYIRLEVQIGQEVQHRPLEEGVLLHLRLAAPVDGVAEVILVIHQVDDGAVHIQLFQAGIAAPPAQVHVDAAYMLDPVVIFSLDAVMEGGDDPGVEAHFAQALGQCAGHVSQTAGFAQRRTF